MIARFREFVSAVSYDPNWRQRSVLAQFEPSEYGRKLSPAEEAARRAVDTAIEFICGKPGGGKSMYATKLIIDELTKGHRPIVTNLALNLARLQEYLDELGVKVHVIDRVRLLEKEQITEFYRYRGVDLVLDLPDEGARFMDWTPSQRDARTAGGVMYVIDECHNYLHPHAFGQKLTPEHPLMQYATQHRKLKDTCYLVTQSVENVHVQVRRLGQQFNYIRNERKETFKGFRRGEGFRRTVYLVPPSSEAAVAIDSDTFRLDVAGLASCYFTAGGVGIAALGTGDGGARKRGLNLNWVYAFGAAALVAIGCVLWFGSDFAVKKVVGDIAKPVPRKQTTDTPKQEQAHPAVGPALPQSNGVAAARPIEYTGSMTMNGRLYVAVKGKWYRVGYRTEEGLLGLEDGRLVVEASEDVRPAGLRPTLLFAEAKSAAIVQK